MKIKEYNTLITAFRADGDAMANGKRVEYTESQGDKDVHANFKAIAKSLDLDPKIVIGVYLQKHTSSIFNYIKKGKTYSNESIGGRITDAIQYLELLYALIQDKKE